MSDDSQYILYRKLDRRSFHNLYPNNKYYCEKIIKRVKIKNIDYITKSIRVYTSTNSFYLMSEITFNTHFISLKEYRKLKLDKINKNQ
jgi:hypothetical protein